MQATLQILSDGTLAILLDQEAAQAVFASVLFASKFHEHIAALSGFARNGIVWIASEAKGTPPCQ